MRREKALFLRLLVFDNLLRAFRAASQGKRDRPEVREFEAHLKSRLWEIRDQLATGVYPGGHYRSGWLRLHTRGHGLVLE